MSTHRPTPSIDDRLAKLMRTVSAAVQGRLEKLPANELLRLAPFQTRVFGVIGRTPGITQITIAAVTGRDKAQVARAIQELESRGFVRRSAHESNWRSQGLSLTEGGKEIWGLADQQRRDLIAQSFSGLTETEKELLGNILGKIIEALHADSLSPPDT